MRTSHYGTALPIGSHLDSTTPWARAAGPSDPPANDGSKVVLLDTDHFSPLSSNTLWVWKAFLRGHNPILYDLGILSGGSSPPDPSEGNPSFDSLEPARHAMGDTRGFAERINLIMMQPC